MLKLKNIYKLYENGTVAVRNASLEFPNNGMVAIIGSSGCGKSTLLNLLSNNDIPSKGERLYKDKAYREYDKEVLLKDFAIVYQDFKLIENLTVYQNIEIGYELANNNLDLEYILQVADKLGIRDILDEKVYSLSGGQQQRVAIARAVVRRPKVIFADEPTGNLDSTNSENVYKILKELSKEILVVIVSHDKAISKFADRIIEMDNGRVVNDYAREEYRQIHNEDTKQEEIKPKTEVLNTDIYYSKKKIAEKPKNSKKTTKISSKNIFSYTKDKSKNRKKQGLSLNSTLGLTIAFNNKGIGKKVVISLICVVMIALILVCASLIFSTYENIFVNHMNKINAPFISYYLSSSDNSISENTNNLYGDFIKNQYGANNYKFNNYSGYRFKCCLNEYFTRFFPVDDKIFDTTYRLDFENWGVIYLDNPSDLNIQLIMGKPPRDRNEIAISKTFYNYILKVGTFKNDEGEIIEFKSENDLIGKYINEFRFTITGVFQDNFKYADLNNLSLVNEEEYYQEMNNNFLSKSILKAEKTFEDEKNLSSQVDGYYLAINHNAYKKNSFMQFTPINEFTKQFYYKDKDFHKELSSGEIILRDKNFIEYYEKTYNKELKINDTIELTFVKADSVGNNNMKISTTLETRKFRIVDINVNSYYKSALLNDIDYNSNYSENNVANIRLVNSKYITQNFLKASFEYIKNINKNLSLDKHLNISFEMIDFNYTSIYERDIIKSLNTYVSIPLLILCGFVLCVLFSIIMSDIIKSKSKDILILKSIGARQRDFLQIFIIYIITIILVQIILGIIVGILLLVGINRFWANIIGNFKYYYNMFWISYLSIVVLIATILIVAIFILWYCLQKLNGKNLRKAFQKQKK